MNDVEASTFARLLNHLDALQFDYERLDGYYEGVQRLEQLGLAIPPKLRRFVVVVNWPRLAADAVEERLDVEGFRFSDQPEADEELWRLWQDNNLDEESQLGHMDCLIFGRSYVCVGANEADEDTPIVTVESPREMVSEEDPRTRQVTAAVRVYDQDPITKVPHRATLYLPDVTIWLVNDKTWREEDRDEHGLGVVPVVPLVNRARTARRQGVSEMRDIIPLTDAASRLLTNLQVAQETHAVPQRGVLGASKGDFVDRDGNPIPAWEAYFGAVWALSNPEAKTFQFSASDLTNFETGLNMYARSASALSGLPPHYLGFTTDNPASADAIRSNEGRLVKRCERKQTPWSGSWENVMRIVDRIRTGEWREEMRRIETLWRDPATPTDAAKADRASKLVGAGILPVEAAWEDMGYSVTRRQQLRAMRERETRVLMGLDGGEAASA